MRTYLAFALALCAFLPARADAQGYIPQRPVADAEIRQMVSDVNRRTMFRAIVGVEETRPYLVVEIFRRARTEGDRDRLVAQYRLDEVFVGNARVPMAEMRQLRDLRWRSRGLDFIAESRRGDLSCRVDVRQRRRTVARCLQMNQYPGGPEPLPPPPPTGGNWSNDPDVIRACGDAFTGPDKEAACRNLTRRAGPNPIPTIKACEQAMEGDDSELGCMQVAFMLPGLTAPQVIAACEQAMEGDDNELRCLDYSRRAGPDPIGTIAACADTASGDPAELACIRGARPRAR